MVKLTREQHGVKAGDQIVIKGTVSFARTDKPIDGPALEKENQRRVGLGMMTSAPFRSIAIENPEVVKGENTPLANYYAQTVYTAKGSGKPTMSVESKSKFAPSYGHIQNGQIVEIADPQKNPAPGQVVYLMLQAFKPKDFNKLGSSFNAIVFEEGEIKFYESAGGNGLAGFGQALNMPVQGMTGQAPAPAEAPAAPAAQAPQQGGFGQAPVEQAPQQGGFGQAPVEQAPQQGGFGQAQTAPQPQADPFGQQQAQGQGSPFGNTGGNGTGFGNSPFA